MRIAVIDPSLFTLPYDSHLCNGLGENGATVTLYGRRLRAGERLVDPAFTFVPLFYHLSERMPAGVHSIKPFRSALKAIEHAIDTLRLLRILSRTTTRPDAVHYQWMPLPAIDRYAIAQLKKKNIPVFFTVHDTNAFNEAPTSRAQKIGWKQSLGYFTMLFVHTEASQQTLERYGIPPEKIAIVPHGLLAFGPMKESVLKEKTILFFGTIKPYKGLAILLHAFQQVADKRNVRLKIVGSCQNDDIQQYRSLIQKLGVEQKVDLDVRFFDDAEIPSMLASATVIVFPYKSIDGSGALLTAIVYEKPFIATDIGIFHEMLKGDPLSLVPANDEIALAHRLAEVLDNPEKLIILANTAKKIKSGIPSWKAIGALTIATYQKNIHG